jgi:hypothetical protein
MPVSRAALERLLLPTTSRPPEESMMRQALGWKEAGFDGSFAISASRTSRGRWDSVSSASAIQPTNRRSASAEVM